MLAARTAAGLPSAAAGDGLGRVAAAGWPPELRRNRWPGPAAHPTAHRRSRLTRAPHPPSSLPLLPSPQIAHEMRATLDKWAELGEKRPAILEVPSKEHPYEKALDPVYQRTKLLLGLRD